MSKFYKKLVQPGRPDDPTLIGAGGFWTSREQRLAQAGGIWPDGVIPNLNYLVVGGGGAGGDSNSLNHGGGGGAGGLLNDTFTAYNANTYTITIGAGGTAVNNGSGNNGGNSVLSNGSTNIITAYGGGGGGFSSSNGNNGASGGGGGEGDAGYRLGGKGIYPGSTYISAPRQGYDGGNASAIPFAGGGGGGAGGAGVGNTPGPGLYINIADGSTIAGTFARGAGTQDEVATANSGNGGQGSHYGFAGENHNGQAGVVILWWSASYNKPSIITGTYTYSNQNGNHVYKFTSSGSIKF